MVHSTAEPPGEYHPQSHNGRVNASDLPAGLEHLRTTAVFDNSTVPAGLLRAHRVAEGVWGRLLVHSGEVVFVFEDHPDERIVVAEGGSVAIPPARLHHVELDQPATFAVEFHRAPSSPAPAAGTESTALQEPKG